MNEWNNLINFVAAFPVIEIMIWEINWINFLTFVYGTRNGYLKYKTCTGVKFYKTIDALTFTYGNDYHVLKKQLESRTKAVEVRLFREVKR